MNHTTLISNPADHLKDRVDVDESSQCWIWTGAKNRQGYGVIRAMRATEGEAQ